MKCEKTAKYQAVPQYGKCKICKKKMRYMVIVNKDTQKSIEKKTAKLICSKCRREQSENRYLDYDKL